MRYSRWWVTPGILFFLALLLSGCAAVQTQALLHEAPPDLARQVELSETPFFPQEEYQCGPATLAMSLSAAGIDITPEALAPHVYLPKREGSLQIEMLAAARQNGALSMTITPRLDTLLTEVAAGNPVIVLQNLGLSWIPFWHYALVIGYDLDNKEIILRSGATEREVLSLTTFEHTWKRSGYWGMVTLPPDRLPKTAEERPTVSALVAFEKTSDAVHAYRAYQAALQRWPDNLTLLLGLGNTAYSSGDRITAANVFYRATERHPDSAPAFNNLAVVLSKLDLLNEARQAAEKALTLGGLWSETAYATLQAIEEATQQRTVKR